MNVNFFNKLSETKRHKIYILQSHYKDLDSSKNFLHSLDIKTLDFGKLLSEKLLKVDANRHLHILVSEFIPKLIEQNTNQIPGLSHKIVALENIGILLEPSFDLNAEKLLAEISKNVHLMILWSEQSNQTGLLNWSNQRDRFNFDFTPYQPKIINYNDEI